MPHAASPAIRWVLFDVGGVLIELRAWSEALPQGRFASAGRSNADALVRDLEASEVFHRFERGRAEVGEFFDEARRHFGSSLGDEEIRRFYLARLGGAMEGMLEIVRDARARGFRVAALSNTTPIHREELERYDAVRLVERLVTSCELGLCKPSREAFERALEILGARPEETLLVDDLEENVGGARRAGLQAVLFRGAHHLREVLGLPRAEEAG